MPEPTDHEVNVRLAEFMGEKVYGCFAPDNSTGACLNMATFTIRCQYCDHGYKKRTESLDLVRGVEMKIERELFDDAYIDKLTGWKFDAPTKYCPCERHVSRDSAWDLMLKTASQRARACLKVIEENQNARTD